MSDSPDAKRPYEAPQLKCIDLRAEEVLVTGCKMDGASDAGNDFQCHAPSPCYAAGS